MSPIRVVPPLFKKGIPLSKTISKFQNIHYRNLPTYSHGSVGGSLGIPQAHFENHRSKVFLNKLIYDLI